MVRAACRDTSLMQHVVIVIYFSVSYKKVVEATKQNKQEIKRKKPSLMGRLRFI
jgi:hypothetical protein